MIDPLIGLLSDPDAQVQRGAAKALLQIGDQRAVPALTAHLRRHAKQLDEDLRRELLGSDLSEIRAIGSFGWADSAEPDPPSTPAPSPF